MTTLLVCHASEAVRAADRLTGGAIDVLAYGRAATSIPMPARATVLALPEGEGGKIRAARAAIELLVRMRRRRYELAIIADPDLKGRPLRGLLLLFPHIAGARRVVATAPDGRDDHITTARAVTDVTQWALLLAASLIVACIAELVLARVPKKDVADVELPPTGSVAYLRTDIELRGTTLTAGGSAAHTAGIVKALQRSGYRVSFWSPGAVAGVTAETVRLPVIAPGNVPGEISELVSGLWQYLRCRRQPPASAFVYQRYSLNNVCGLLLARRWQVPLVLEANASEVRWREGWSRLRFSRLARACERALLRRADRVVTVSDMVRRDLLEEGADPARVKTVPNGVEIERFAGAEPTSLPLAAGSFVVTFVGLFYPWHGVHVLAEAFVRLHRRHPEARLLLIGDGEEAARARAILEDGGAGDAFLMPGLVPSEDVPGYLAASDVVVSPHAKIHDFIGSPIKMFEYMASGRAIVASRVGQIADMLRDGENALVVDPEDPDALAAALDTLHDDLELRRRLGSAAQQEARQAHSWDARLAAIVDSGAGPTVA